VNTPVGETKSFAARLWVETKALHVQAERSGMMARILRGRASRRGHALMLRNLLPAYIELEDGLQRHRQSPAVSLFARAETYRVATLHADLEALEGADWRTTLHLVPEATHYAEAITRAGKGDGVGLIAHAYTRYLGDLSGGQIMQGVLAKNLGLGAGELAFYRFDEIADIAAFKADYHANLDRAGVMIADPDHVLAEAADAFRHNMAVSDAVSALEHGAS
jgi:heme oxygenase